MGEKYKILSIAGTDIGGWGRIMKKYMERLGHEFVNVVFEDSYLKYSQDGDETIVLSQYSDEEGVKLMHQLYKETDFYVLRWMVDEVVNGLGLKHVLTKNNFIYKTHGTETRTYGMPWNLELWKFHPHGTVAGFLETPLWQNLPSPSYYHIERPCDYFL